MSRWGSVAKIFVTVVCLYNMGIGIVSEFTAIGDFFENVIHGSRIMIVVLIGCLTSIYIAFGGLSVSVKTDQVQGVIVCIMFIFTVIYVACTFRMSDPRPPLPDELGATTAGYNSIVAMTISLLASVSFSEVFHKKTITNNFFPLGLLVKSLDCVIKASPLKSIPVCRNLHFCYRGDLWTLRLASCLGWQACQ